MELLHEQRDSIVEAVDGHGGLDERLLSVLIEPAHPSGDGGGRDEKAASSLDRVPAGARPEHQDGEPLDGRVVRPLLGRQAVEASAQNAQLLGLQRDETTRGVELSRHAGARVRGALEAGAHLGKRESLEPDRTEQRALDAAFPVARQRDEMETRHGGNSRPSHGDREGAIREQPAHDS